MMNIEIEYVNDKPANLAEGVQCAQRCELKPINKDGFTPEQIEQASKERADTAKEFRQKRREEALSRFENREYGKNPPFMPETDAFGRQKPLSTAQIELNAIHESWVAQKLKEIESHHSI